MKYYIAFTLCVVAVSAASSVHFRKQSAVDTDGNQPQTPVNAILRDVETVANDGLATAFLTEKLLRDAIEEFRAQQANVLPRTKNEQIIMQQLFLKLAKIYDVHSARKLPFLVQMVVNALLGSSHFQGLIDRDDFLQCLKQQGYEPNSDLFFGLIENDLVLQFLTEDELVLHCIELSGGMQFIVQNSPVVAYAYNLASTFGATDLVQSMILENLGTDLGGQINGWLQETSGSLFMLDSVNKGNIQMIAANSVQVQLSQTLVQAESSSYRLAQQLLTILKPHQMELGLIYRQLVAAFEKIFGRPIIQ